MSRPSKAGFGLMEALASIFILSLMFLAVSMLNFSNHNTVLRLATRNEATQVGQRILDSLQAVGISSVTGDTITVSGDTSRALKSTGTYTRKYVCEWTVKAIYSTGEGTVADPINSIIRAKKISLSVKWSLNHRDTNTINLSTVVQ
ncbi:MAG TPA: hypothetical protein VLM37_10850 [Fibrobacteraceae bacterium]|nr:hypothetical protein [Fibrobacteraceae bacterium]